jgi:outer membrane immunogenic protein
MKRFLLASVALTFGGHAFAADMPVKAPPAAVPSFSWTGCYLGGHIGVGGSHDVFSDPTGTLFGPAGSSIGVGSRDGALGGAQAGCDYEFANNWVIGLAGDFSWAHITGQDTDPFFAGKGGNTITLNSKTDKLASATGRLGYAWDHLLVYGKGGAAWAHDQYSIQNLVSYNGIFCFAGGGFVACNPAGSDTRVGWTAGFGLEWAITNNWSALLEYDHYGFGTKSVTLTDPNNIGAPALANISERIDAVKVGLNYRFGLGR